MKVILLKDIPKIGNKFDIKNVSNGYAQNYLIPNKLAEVATKATEARIALARSLHEEKRKETEAELLKKLKDIKNAAITIKSKTNDKGILFAGIRNTDLVSHIKKELSLDINSDYIVLEEPIKEVGKHSVEIVIQDKKASLKVIIEKDK